MAATAFDRYLKERLKDGGFAREYRKARSEIDATDDLVRALDRARVLTQVSKAELARRIGAKPEMVRRLLTAAGANPTMGTVLKITTALGYHLELVPDRGSRSVRRQRAARIAHKR